MKFPSGLLMIEPEGAASATPVIDALTRKMTAAWRRRRDGITTYMGYHHCVCGAVSDCRDHWVGAGLLTNALCVHYLAFHRADVPREELAKVAALPAGTEEPSAMELSAPPTDGRVRVPEFPPPIA